MITFLHGIRHSLIESGSACQYALQAIGEIALVIIGILIVLQINNWNEQQKGEKNVESILWQNHSELSVNLNDTKEILRYYMEKDTLAKKQS